MVCIFVFGGISGAHLNPAVSIGLAVAGHLKWQKLPLYFASQIFGGYLGSLVSYGLHKDHLQYNYVMSTAISIPDFDNLPGEARGKIMASLSAAGTGTSLGIGFITEIILTAILLMAVMAVIDRGNMKYPPFMIAFTLCLTVAAMAMAHGTVTGTILNPARDLAPRLAAKTLGWDSRLCFQNVNFSGKSQPWWIVGVFAPPVGAVIGVLIYNFFVGAQLTNNRDDLDDFASSIPNKLENGDMFTSNQRFIPRSYAHPNLSNGVPPPPAVNGHYNPAFVRDPRTHPQY
jgi:glycerol uptake facilitator protein